MGNRERENRARGSDLELARGYGDREHEHGESREDPFGRGFDQPEPGRTLEPRHERRYSLPYDRWNPNDYVFYAGEGYHREFIEPYKLPGEGRYAGRGPKNYVRSDERIREEINERLTEHPDIDASDVVVRVDAGEITLEGAVPDRLTKRLAEDAASAARGVRDVHNHLKVGFRRDQEIPTRP